MGDHDAVAVRALDGRADRCPVVIAYLQAVFAHQRGLSDRERHFGSAEDVLDDRFPHLEGALGVEVDLVDRAARRDECNVHFSTRRNRFSPRTGRRV